MNIERSAGILLHPTSLPGKFGIGDLGPSAFHFVDFLKAAGQTLWQVFPLGPTGYGDSPYQCFSAFAGNPLLISPEFLQRDGLLSDKDLSNPPKYDEHKIDFGSVIEYKTKLLRKAFENFKKIKSIETECKDFLTANNFWLEDYALFMSAKAYHGGVQWAEWDETIAFRKDLASWKKKLENEINYQIFIQHTFNKQWIALREYAHQSEIKIIGDLPIFIAYDSADLWANKELFTVRKDGTLELVAGVPPDYFSETGQLWGNPLYKWKEMEKDDFLWWRRRISNLLTMVDIVRIDHFRGFDAYWEIPGDAKTAIDGRWVKAPGHKFFNSIKKALGELPIIAEDLGVITDSVEELRDHFGFPGIKILQFGLGEDGDKKFLPHNHIKNCVVHTGSHDNETTRGFLESEMQKNSGIYEWAQAYFNYYGESMTYEMIRSAYQSPANICVIPMQDILNLGNQARMNFPGKLGGNWAWRFTWDQVANDLASWYKQMTIMFERPPLKKNENAIIEIADE
ncbi:MAG: 4-alpha-glucanotransferase [Ignavibacteria bacterium]|nr:MAG: 4-alpha-glucanotransferase [Ignavibacteria bacterium]KAF0162464.1 MAG: 4-alpha-glucanotransferase [Ignavibacteria bacterium]